jgi:peptidoglycan/xylan/chitin deacetylase (PgdA/CDA1 family)
MKKVYLTIDDGPSAYATELVDYLSANGIGAVLFCRGDNMKKRPDKVIYAIKHGFIIGNHSFSHPHFGKLSEEEARKEMEETDEIVNALYAKAGETRPAKFFRFPYHETGGTEESKKANQGVLKQLGYSNPLDSAHLNWFSDVSVEDWHVDESNVQEKLETAEKYLTGLKENAVLGMHDQDANVRLGLFQKTREAIKGRGFGFYGNSDFKRL